jgi:glycosyltransferase involved in cell wall biosynthesis
MPYAANVVLQKIPGFNFKTALSVVGAIWKIPIICFTIFKTMAAADHIHLRCPGNIGLLGCIIQIFFPRKQKTAKYAGNWDPSAIQPWSYRLQKWILSNRFLTRNMKVLVYGNWPESTSNIKPFFTATYRETDKSTVFPRDPAGVIRFVFVGTLAEGKRPLYAVGLIEALQNRGTACTLELFGEGSQRFVLEQYITSKNLMNSIVLRGNQSESIVRKAYKDAHFLVLPSKSEGWPKAVAEAMFWGCIPVVTPVSCVPFMLGDAARGILLGMDIDKDSAEIAALIENPGEYRDKAEQCMAWSRQYTLDLFENEIKALLTR